MAKKTQTETKLTIRAKAFTGEGIRKHSVLVDDGDGVVRVYDSVAGYYTPCHALSKAAIKRIIAKAKAAR